MKDLDHEAGANCLAGMYWNNSAATIFMPEEMVTAFNSDNLKT